MKSEPGRKCVKAIALMAALIISMASDCFNVFNSNTAPKIVMMISKPLNAPNTENAIISVIFIFQNDRADITQTSHATGITFLAGRLRPTKRTISTIIGKNAIIAYTAIPFPPVKV